LLSSRKKSSKFEEKIAEKNIEMVIYNLSHKNRTYFLLPGEHNPNHWMVGVMSPRYL